MGEKKKIIYNIAMILCFVYAGISAILLVYQIYYLVRSPAMRFNPMINASIDRGNIPNDFMSLRRGRFSPINIIGSSLGLVISSFAGFTIMSLLRKKEKKEITKKVIDTMLTPEEKNVIKVLEENNDELTQSELVTRTRLSKVKVHRIIKRLESLKVVSKYPYGVTNKIKLEKQIYEK